VTIVAVPTITFHVTPSANRDSIERHGLDWRRFREGTGLAGPNPRVEAECIFLARDLEEADWFVTVVGRRHPSLDVWEVTLPHDFDPWTEKLPHDAPYIDIAGFLATTDVITADRLRLIKAGTAASALDEER
jgi:hypothetical protein